MSTGMTGPLVSRSRPVPRTQLMAPRPIAKTRLVDARAEIVPAWLLQLVFIAAHAPLALAIPKHSRLATLHALTVFGIGVIAALMPRRPQLVACVAAYITGAAVFWRMKAAPNLPWEFAKYAIVVLLTLALVFSVRVRQPFLPIAYFGLLLPSAVLTMGTVPWVDAREMLSFNLSGPLALAVSVVFFSSVTLSATTMRWIATALLAPVVGIATLAAYNLQQALNDPEFEFYGGSSNATSSGGFGPNQVSAILGLGILAILIYLIVGPRSRVMLAAQIALILFLTRQTLITLSRGGVYMAIGALMAASVYLLRDRRARGLLMIGAIGVGAIVGIVIVPKLQAITGGVLVARMENTSGTGRDLLIRGDLDSWEESPLIGVGPGLGGANRLKYFYVPTAHTEYTRMVAEHGLFGLLALVALAAMAIRGLGRQRTLRGRAISAALLAYGVLFMTVDATRLAAPAFAFGLAAAEALPPSSRRRTAGGG